MAQFPGRMGARAFSSGRLAGSFVDNVRILGGTSCTSLSVHRRCSAAASVSFHFPPVRPGGACRFGKLAANCPTLVQGCLPGSREASVRHLQ